MKNGITLALAIGCSVFVAGCATDMGAAMGQLNDSLGEFGKAVATSAEAGSASSRGSGNSLAKTKLMGVFNRSLSTDGQPPEWPKVAITNLYVPADQASSSRLRLRANDCVHFDAVLWYDAKHNEKFNDVSLCALELPKRSNDFVTTWRTFPISGKTSGQQRSDGPVPPRSKLPSDSLTDRWMTGLGIYFIGSMLTMMGYDPQFIEDDRRFWVKKVRS